MTIKTIRHKQNPFIDEMTINLAKKQVKISTLGEGDNILVNNETGEISGTHVVAYKKVDSTKFVKTFADYMSFTFDLSKAGNKALRVVMWAMQKDAIDTDILNLDKYTLENFIEKHKSIDPPMTLSLATFGRGLAEIEKAKIIAKSQRRGIYFINPNCMFNGSRIAFTTLIERDDSNTKEIN